VSHSAAGTRRVIDLHGRLDRVVCLDCRATSGRASLAERLVRANPSWHAAAAAVNPDGDVEISEDVLDCFVVVDCAQCGGTLMPDVVYFGGTVPPERVASAFEEVGRARSLLVLGSSLTVHSGRRFVVAAAKAGTPVAIVNSGPTRGDEYAALKLDASLGETLQDLVARLVDE
jgi:NAD-dependent SIR2 family protein deacetylase